PARVIHLAAQAGVRHSMVDPAAYVNSNLVGFVNVMEGCRHSGVEHFVFASSSSVYGVGGTMPFCVGDNADSPLNLYAASKRSNELLAYSYSHLYRIPTTGLRFFTVYGPWGRPDMAPILFTRAILEGRPIDVFNHGKMKRDFTYVDDIATGVVRVADHIPGCDPKNEDTSEACAPYRLYNIGNNNPVGLLRFIEILEELLGRKAIKNLLPMPPTEALVTCANVDDLMRDVGFRPDTPIEVGLRRFVEWYRLYYNV
ncbi:MAG: NAD-dependent epimerase/dehydratase family protein, partial [Armatimonadota bacterium]|nr:NAD-dependent epimerase/dehydratase family protein [Armatimonadota bacterium]